MPVGGEVVIVRDERDLFERTAHLFATATSIACAARDERTWRAGRPARSTASTAVGVSGTDMAGRRIRKLYQPSALLDPVAAARLREVDGLAGVEVRITTAEINETILLDRKVAILAGDIVDGVRSFSVVSAAELVQGVSSLFEAAWRSSAALAVHDASVAEIRLLAPRILDLLASGCKDETAARELGVGLRTYRRRVAELMTALDASSRFQAGARARELGLV